MKIGFIGEGNAVRSIMAEAVARKLIKEALLKADIYSAGVKPEEEVNPQTLKILQEKGYQTQGLRPKSLKEIPYNSLDLVIVVSSEAKEKAPFVLNHKRRENWNVELPTNLTQTSLTRTLESIENLVRELFRLN